MLIYNTGAVTPLQPTKAQLDKSKTVMQQKAGQYDTIEVTNYSKEERFARELSGKIAQEVRVGQPEQVDKLKEQVQSNTYKYDIDKLTAQILLFGGM